MPIYTFSFQWKLFTSLPLLLKIRLKFFQILEKQYLPLQCRKTASSSWWGSWMCGFWRQRNQPLLSGHQEVCPGADHRATSGHWCALHTAGALEPISGGLRVTTALRNHALMTACWKWLVWLVSFTWWVGIPVSTEETYILWEQAYFRNKQYIASAWS